MDIIMFSDQKDIFTSRQKDFIREKLEGKKIAYIASTSDYTRKYYNRTLEFYKQFGIKELSYIDVADEYIKDFDKTLNESEIIHLSGGMVNLFAANIYKRNYDILIKEAVDQGKLLIGVSAGAIIMGPDLEITKIYEKVQNNEYQKGMGIVDFVLVPHIDTIREKLNSISINYELKECKDSDILYINNNGKRLIE